jgi:membrane fusion protein, heavy metal efflux system
MKDFTRKNIASIWIVLALALPLFVSCGGGTPSPAASQPAEADRDEEAGSHPAVAKAEGGERQEGGDAEHDEDAGKHVELTAEQIEKAEIGLAEAGPVDLSEHLSLYGVIAPNAERVLEVSARFPGVIRSVKKRVGDSVRRGETLATIESNESLQTYAVAAPLDGVVTLRNANEGAQTSDGPLFTVADLSTVWVEVSVFPRDVAKVKVGQTVRVRSADTGLSAQGKVVYVSPFGSSTSQTLSARVQLANPDRKWPPGLYVTAEVILSSTTVPLGVRAEALQTLEDQSVVFVKGAEGFEPRPVKTGRSDGEVIEVLSGVTAGERYATRNSFILKAELGKGEVEDED